MKNHVSRTLFKGATLIDGCGGAPRSNCDLLVADGRIVDIADAGENAPDGCKVVSVKGKYIIPGLMDANVHLVLDLYAGPLTLIRYENRYDEIAVEAAQVALKSGLTTIFDTQGPRRFLQKARDAINDGRETGARIFIAGAIIGLGGPCSCDIFPLNRSVLPEDYANTLDQIWEDNVGPALVWKSPEQVRDEVRKYLEYPIDFVKFAVTTHRGDQEHLMFSQRVIDVIVDEAHKSGRIAQTHTTTNEAHHMALEADVDLMQHVDLTFGDQVIPDEIIRRLADRRMPSAILPQTDLALQWFSENVGRTPFLKRYEVMDHNVRNLLQSGANLLLSTDAGVYSRETLSGTRRAAYVTPHESLLTMGEGHFHWLLAMEQKGMPAMAALQAATINIARAYGVSDTLGTLERGKIADFIVLNRDPIASAANYRSIEMVVKEGVLVDREALPSPRRLTTP